MQRAYSNVSNKSGKMVATRRSGLMRNNSKGIDEDNGPNFEKINPPKQLNREISITDMFATKDAG